MNTVLSLKERYESLKAENPKLRIRDMARSLDVSEAELVALRTGEGVARLDSDFKALLAEVQSLGTVMALTRNDDVVHERKGVYNNVSFNGEVGLVLDKDIDLRIFVLHWRFGFSVLEGERHSLQFFDKSGEAVHKIYCTEQTSMEAYHALVEKYTAAEQHAALVIERYPDPETELPDAEIDIAGFREAWLLMKDTHEFFGLTRKYGVTRTQALRLAPEGLVQQVPNDTARKMLELASERQVPIMVFAASRGCIQIHTGTVTKLLTTGPWFNVLDEMFSMHLREANIAATYVVQKPGDDGIVTSIEVFDADGKMIVQFFGKRKPGVPELESWREIVRTLHPDASSVPYVRL